MKNLYSESPSDAGADNQSTAFRSSEVLILLDGSESTGVAYGSGTRASAMAEAVTSLVDAYQGRIAFGLMPFPHTLACGESAAPGCCVDAPSVELGLRQGTAIRDALSKQPAPQGSSSMVLALQAAAVLFRGRPSAGESRHVLLVTDGQPGCGRGLGDASASDFCQEAEQAVLALANLDPPVTTLILSPGQGDPLGKTDCLLALGQAAHASQGRDASALSNGFTTEDLTSLAAALEATFVPPRTAPPECEASLTLDSTLTTSLSVYVDGQMIPEDSHNGWVSRSSYISGGKTLYTVSLRGLYCERLRQFRYSLVEVKYLCPIARLLGPRVRGGYGKT